MQCCRFIAALVGWVTATLLVAILMAMVGVPLVMGAILGLFISSVIVLQLARR
jgi:hypothetical protein